MDSTNLVTSVNAIISPKKKQPVISFLGNQWLIFMFIRFYSTTRPLKFCRSSNIASYIFILSFLTFYILSMH